MHNEGFYENPCLLGAYVMSIGKQLPTFRMIAVLLSSTLKIKGPTVLRNVVNFDIVHGITSQKTWLFITAAVRKLYLALSSIFKGYRRSFPG